MAFAVNTDVATELADPRLSPWPIATSDPVPNIATVPGTLAKVVTPSGDESALRTPPALYARTVTVYDVLGFSPETV